MKQQIDSLLSGLGGGHSWNEQDTPVSLTIPVNLLHDVMQGLYRNEGLYFDLLSCLTGIDNGPEVNTMEVVYNLFSIPYENSLMVKVILDRNQPVVPTVSDIWRTADWLERETYDLLGIVFSGHKDLRRILLPADWEGYPLRKDYKEQEKYRGIKVAY